MLTPGSTVCGRSHACSRACTRCRGGHGVVHNEPTSLRQEYSRQHSCVANSLHPCCNVTVLLSLTCSLQQSTLQSDKSTWALANLLDSNLMHVRQTSSNVA